ncbi:MAG: hypothetical protein H8D97_00760 [Proteobacteria bacterium]|nr:hypothetical protein [Pseudomonadota bacterium]
MFKNALQDVPFISEYYGEYLEHVNRYKNLKRPSIFCRYLKINKDASTFHPDIKGTHDRHYSGVIYDNYEYTPAYLTPQRISQSQDDQEKTGRMFNTGPLEMTIYTIENPNHNDLVIFPYSPNDSLKCYRVVDVNIHKNAIKDKIYFTNITIDSAPIDHNKLTFLNSYIYLMTQEMYVPAQKYIRIIDEYKKFQEIFYILETKYWNKKYELYYYIYNGEKIAPLKQNQIIYDFLTKRRHNTRYFTYTKIPFGVKEYSDPLGDGEGFNINTEKRTDMDGTNNPIILGWEDFLNSTVLELPWNISFYYFVDGRPEFGDKLPSEYTTNIIKYEIKEETLLMDFAALIQDFKG